MSGSRYKIYNDNVPYFLTCTIVNWLPFFNRPAVAQIILDSLSFLQREKRLVLYWNAERLGLALSFGIYGLLRWIGDHPTGLVLGKIE